MNSFSLASLGLGADCAWRLSGLSDLAVGLARALDSQLLGLARQNLSVPDSSLPAAFQESRSGPSDDFPGCRHFCCSPSPSSTLDDWVQNLKTPMISEFYV